MKRDIKWWIKYFITGYIENRKRNSQTPVIYPSPKINTIFPTNNYNSLSLSEKYNIFGEACRENNLILKR